MSSSLQPDGAANDGIAALVAASADELLSSLRPAFRRASPDPASAAQPFESSAWAAVREAGMLLAMLEEDQGGVGMRHAFRIIKIAGMHAVPLPLCETMAANWLLSVAGLKPAADAASFSARPAKLTRAGGGWHISGTIPNVPWGRCCDLVVSASAADDRRYLVRVAREHLVCRMDGNIAGEPRDTCQIDCGVDSVAPIPPKYGDDPLLALGAAMRTAQIAGAARAVLSQTVSYARERTQFGRPIGAFQAVQQQLAIMATHTAAASSAADLAATAAAGDLDSHAIAIAKVRAGESAGAVAAIAHQIHGAIGFTAEHSLHTLSHRLWSWRDEFGSDVDWAVEIGRHLAALGATNLWKSLTAV
jgi:acyl-CoA dehydrogenase